MAKIPKVMRRLAGYLGAITILAPNVSCFVQPYPTYAQVPPGQGTINAHAVGGSSGGQPMAGAASDPLSTPPYTGRAYFGWVPYERNSLVKSVCGSNSSYVEMYLDGQPLMIVNNRTISQRRVSRGDHAGRDVNIIPPSLTGGSVQLDSPGEHGIEFWCYTDVPGVGMVQTYYGRDTAGGVQSWCGNVGQILCR